MKYLIKIIILTALLTGCMNNNIKTKSKNVQKLISLESDYIEIDGKTVRLMANIKNGAKVELYFGEDKNELKKISSIEQWDNSKKLYLQNLEKGKKYYYYIQAEKDGAITKTDRIEFRKNIDDFDKKESKWAKEAVFYQIFVRAFADSNGDGVGDFKGITAKLDYLKELGINGIWLMPVFKTGTYHGYDVEDYYSLNSEYGTIDDFEEMIIEANKRGIKIIMDFVINHTSDRNKWFQSAYIRGDYRNYYIWKEDYENPPETGMWGNQIWSGELGNEYHTIFTGNMPDLNYRNSRVREEMKKAADFWIAKGVSGFRLDAARHIDDFDHEVTTAWWKEFNNHVKSKDNEIFLVGECWDENPENTKEYMYLLDSVFNFMVEDDIRNLLKGKKVDIAARAAAEKELFQSVYSGYTDSIFIGNHDFSRIVSEISSEKKAKIAAVMLMTIPGTPFIYYGDEIGQKGTGSDEMYRMPFEWSRNNNSRFDTKWAKSSFIKANDGISLEEQYGKEDSMYEFYKKLIKIKKENKVLFNGKIEKIESDFEKITSYKVYNEQSEIEIYCNNSNIPFKINNMSGTLLIGKTVKSGEESYLEPGESIIIKRK